jgi:hypothetical protein
VAHREHRYPVTITWTGNRGTGTSAYRAYDRAHDIAAADDQGRGLRVDPCPRSLCLTSEKNLHYLRHCERREAIHLRQGAAARWIASSLHSSQRRDLAVERSTSRPRRHDDKVMSTACAQFL